MDVLCSVRSVKQEGKAPHVQKNFWIFMSAKTQHAVYRVEALQEALSFLSWICCCHKVVSFTYDKGQDSRSIINDTLIFFFLNQLWPLQHSYKDPTQRNSPLSYRLGVTFLSRRIFSCQDQCRRLDGQPVKGLRLSMAIVLSSSRIQAWVRS